MSFHHFGFASPYALLALMLVPAFVGFTALVRRRRSRYTASFTNLGLLRAVVAKRRRPWQRHVPTALLALALAAFALALARPRVQVTSLDRSTTIELLVDVSSSMQARDIRPTRLDAAEQAMRLFVDQLPPHDKVGLITFSDRVEELVQPTVDHTTLENALAVLNPEGGTALGDGVDAAVKSVVASLSADGVRHTPGTSLPAAIILESDGGQNRGVVSPLAAAKLAMQVGVPVDAVVVGTPPGTRSHGHLLRQGYITEPGPPGFKHPIKIPVPPDPDTIALVARVSGGELFTAPTSEKLDTVYRNFASHVGKHRKPTDITPWFDLAAALLLVGGVGFARAQDAALP